MSADSSTDDNVRKVRSPRQRVLKSGKIVMMNQWIIVDCTIRDISETGAKLICGDQAAIPNEFRFFVPSENSIRTAHVVWRRDNQLGIAFTSAKEEAPRQKLLSGEILSVA